MNVAVWAGVVVIGGVGAVLRFLVDRAVASRVARSFPFGTLIVNLSGAMLLGLISGLTLSHNVALLAGTAFVGSRFGVYNAGVESTKDPKYVVVPQRERLARKVH
jgi:CrcB protein